MGAAIAPARITVLVLLVFVASVTSCGASSAATPQVRFGATAGLTLERRLASASDMTEAAPAQAQSMTLSTYSVVVNQTVTFTATGFLASTADAPQFTTQRVVDIANSSTHDLPSILIDIFGEAIGTFTIDPEWGFSRGDFLSLTLTGPDPGGGTASVSTALTIRQSTVTGSANGAIVTYSGTGFAAAENVVVSLVPVPIGSAMDVPLSTTQADWTGSFSGVAAVPIGATLAPGVFQVSATGARSGYIAQSELVIAVPMPTATSTPAPTNTFTPILIAADGPHLCPHAGHVSMGIIAVRAGDPHFRGHPVIVADGLPSGVIVG